MALFYPKNQDVHYPPSKISQILQTSLSKALSNFYPFAGRLMNNNLSVDCNDMGAQFVEARIKCPMSESLKQQKSHLKDLVFVISLSQSNLAGGSLVLVQLTYFDCGGMALAASISHKVCDLITKSNFMKDWMLMAHQSSDIRAPPFNGASLFPPVDDPLFKGFNPTKGEICIRRRYLFHASKIEELKALASNSGVDRPTRVEVVSALLYSCAVSASMKNSASFEPSQLASAVNLRAITVPSLPQESVGNFLTHFSVSVNTEDEMKFPELV
ncbi:hypothetical protein ACH5RR_007175 [Cinchona calisaya]|uniref:Uncharacterized protein n=1 Tax=Cinchona calisaya TaxID=153742 RepID=A0ABD3AR01_9GENT